MCLYSIKEELKNNDKQQEKKVLFFRNLDYGNNDKQSRKYKLVILCKTDFAHTL
jgi:hypothetical protein